MHSSRDSSSTFYRNPFFKFFRSSPSELVPRVLSWIYQRFPEGWPEFFLFLIDFRQFPQVSICSVKNDDDDELVKPRDILRCFSWILDSPRISAGAFHTVQVGVPPEIAFRPQFLAGVFPEIYP